MRNSRHFVEVMARVKLSPDELLVIIDASSLFMKVPMQEAVDVICKRLQDDKTLNEKTALEPNTIASFLHYVNGFTCISSGSQPKYKCGPF